MVNSLNFICFLFRGVAIAGCRGLLHPLKDLVFGKFVVDIVLVGKFAVCH